MCYQVKGSLRGSKVKHIIQYVDYGSSAPVTTTELRNLPTDYWKIPIQAIPCSLSLDDDDDEYIVSKCSREHLIILH